MPSPESGPNAPQENIVNEGRIEQEPELVRIDEYGLIGDNYYYKNSERLGISKDELEEAGVTGTEVYVHRDIVEILQKVEEELYENSNYRLYIKEGYRSEMLYDLVYEATIELNIQRLIEEGVPQQEEAEQVAREEADRIYNMEGKPHATGKSVDVVLYNPETEEQVFMRDGSCEPDSYFFDFHKNELDLMEEDDPRRAGYEEYQRKQEFLAEIMERNGFRLGTKNEYWHFNYEPDTPRDY